MIWESQYWKDELLRTASKLNKRLNQKRWPESSMASLEKEIMIGFYIIYKLIAAHKLSNYIFEKPHSIYRNSYMYNVGLTQNPLTPLDSPSHNLLALKVNTAVPG